MADPLAEYDAVVRKVDDAVAAASASAQEQLTCNPGCDSCCVDGLTVLPVEAAAVVRHVEAHGLDYTPKGQGHCVFLDVAGRCSVYAARPLLCRTHGLPLKMPGGSRGSLRVVDDDVSVCALNFTARAPAKQETLDATAVLKLLTVVDARYRAAAGVDDERVALRDLVEGGDDDDDDG